MKTWTIIYLNAVRCHPLYIKISQTMWREHRTVSCSREKKTELKAYGAAEEMSVFHEHDSRRSESDKLVASILSSQPHTPTFYFSQWIFFNQNSEFTFRKPDFFSHYCKLKTRNSDFFTIHNFFHLSINCLIFVISWHKQAALYLYSTFPNT